MNERIGKLKEAIERRHPCAAWHVSSEPVIELFQGKMAWDGKVEVFRLVGHPKARRCYAWSYEEGGETQYATELEIPPVDSAEMAVKVALAAKSRE